MSRGRLRVGMLGAGRIAQGFDAPGSPHVLSMAHAVRRSAGFELGGFYDLDPERAAAAESKWSCPPSPREREQWLSSGWDVVYVATPDAQHADDLRDLLRHRPRAILAEKPVASDPREGLALLEAAQAAGVPVLVNYPRRWATGVQRVGEAIRSGAVGRPLSAVFTYYGGTVHNGSHILDLFHTWWGGDWQPELRGRHRFGAHLCLSQPGHGLEALFQDLPADRYNAWEHRIYCEGGKVELGGSPETLSLSTPRPNPLFAGFRTLGVDSEWRIQEEPLLCRALDVLLRMIEEPAFGAQRTQHEVEAQRFLTKVLRLVE